VLASHSHSVILRNVVFFNFFVNTV